MEQADATQGAVQRKGVRAVYNALRIQINRFEEAFVQLQGRPPKGRIEKAPILNTYAQYRELKRVIRGDAARRIQALFRGWKTRKRNQQNNNFNILKEITEDWNERIGSNLPQGEKQLKNKSSTLLGVSTVYEIRGPAESIGDARVEETSSPNLEYYDEEASTESAPHSEVSTSSESSYSIFSDLSEDELEHLSLKELRLRKRELKELLKEYDIRFTLEHGRMPNKSEKEPIRHLYNQYNALKDQIATKHS